MEDSMTSEKPLPRILGYTVVLTAVLVFGLCLVGVFGVWVANTPVTRSILATVRPLIATLDAAQTAMNEVSQGVGSVEGIVGSIKDLLDSAGLLNNLLPGVGEGVGNLAGSLENLQSTLADTNGKVVAAQGMLKLVETSVTRWVDILSIILTIMFLWIAFSQASLFIHGWYYATGNDLLSRRVSPPGGEAAQQTQPESTTMQRDE
jgi:hypothetical protein